MKSVLLNKHSLSVAKLVPKEESRYTVGTEDPNMQSPKEPDQFPVTVNDACREYARNVGYLKLGYAWIVTPWDTWEPNPYYVGPPRPHPELGSEC